MMHVKRWILMILLGAACLLLLASCGSDEHSANTDISNGPIGTNIHDTNVEAQKNTASDHDGFEDGQIYTEPPYILEEDDPLAAEIQAALAEKKPTLIWAEDCFVEERKEAKIWHYTLVDCNGFFEEMLEELFPNAPVENREESPGATVIELKSGQNTLRCVSEVSGRFINLYRLPGDLGETVLPKAVGWLSQKTGVEMWEWTDFDTARTDAIAYYTGQVDGLQIGAASILPINGKLQGTYGVYLAPSGSVEFFSPISVGEEAGTVRLDGDFSQEELRLTLEAYFNPSEPLVKVYRSSRLCYLIHEEKELLIPVWWVKGVNFDLETGKGTPFEYVFDAETGSRYDMGGA